MAVACTLCVQATKLKLFPSKNINDRNILLPSLKVVGQTLAKIHILDEGPTRFWITSKAYESSGITSRINVILESGIKLLTIILVNFSTRP